MDNGSLRDPRISGTPLEIYIAGKTTPLLAICPLIWPLFFAANGKTGLRTVLETSGRYRISTESPRARVKPDLRGRNTHVWKILGTEEMHVWRIPEDGKATPDRRILQLRENPVSSWGGYRSILGGYRAISEDRRPSRADGILRILGDRQGAEPIVRIRI